MTSAKSLFDQCIGPMEEQASQAIMNNGQKAGYGSTDDAVRYHAAEPIYSAVWMISDADEIERNYSPAHMHDYPELNVLVGEPGDLVYRIRIGDEEREIKSPVTILIPAGVQHSANLVRGHGAFVAIRLVPEQLKLSNSQNSKS